MFLTLLRNAVVHLSLLRLPTRYLIYWFDRSIGPFTWTNYRKKRPCSYLSSVRSCSSLIHMCCFGSSSVNNLPLTCSDHCPLVFSAQIPLGFVFGLRTMIFIMWLRIAGSWIGMLFPANKRKRSLLFYLLVVFLLLVIIFPLNHWVVFLLLVIRFLFLRLDPSSWQEFLRNGELTGRAIQ